MQQVQNLLHQKPKFVWLMTTNSMGIRQCKIIPYSRFEKEDCEVGMCSGAYFLPVTGSVILPEVGGDASSEVRMKPIRSTLTKNLPWAPHHAICMAELFNKNGDPWEFDGRQMLKKALRMVKDKLDIDFEVGFEIEFQILNSDNEPYVTGGHYCSADSMDAHLEVVDEITKALSDLGIKVELIHKEDANSQIEIVMEHGPVMEIIDKYMLSKHIISAVLRRKNLKACFVPTFR